MFKASEFKRSFPLLPALMHASLCKDTAVKNQCEEKNKADTNCERCENNQFFSLKKKNLIYLVVTSLYILFVAVYMINEKDHLLSQFYAYQQAEDSNKVLTATSHSLRIVNTSLLKGFLNNQPIDLIKSMHSEFIDLQKNYTHLQPLYPEHARQFKDLVKLLASVVVNPSPQSSSMLKQALVDNQAQLDLLLKANSQQTQQLLAKYHDSIHVVAINASFLGLLGIILFGSILSLFFKRMTDDISALQGRVKKIMNGYRQQDLDISRNDELELLACGINELAQTLSLRESQLELERRKQYTQQKQGAIEHLAAGLVHEMGNPVAAISGLIDVMQSSEMSNSDKNEASEQIQLYTQRMSTIIEDLSKLAVPLEKDFQLVDINHLIHSCIELLYLDERTYGNKISLDLEPQLAAVNGVAEQLNQVLSNVIINAYEALSKTSGKDKQISIRTRSDHQSNLIIEITDSGCGIETAIVDKVIDTFFSTKEDSQGTGLGLPLSRSIINAHSGDISLSSTPGQGTTVQIKLPVVN